MFKFAATSLAMIVFAAGGLPTVSAAQPSAAPRAASTIAERQYANAVSSFRQGRYPEAFGRFVALADAGYAPAAEQALWMYRHGPTLFGREWDSNSEQLAAWARLAGQRVPEMDGGAQTPRLSNVSMQPTRR